MSFQNKVAAKTPFLVFVCYPCIVTNRLCNSVFNSISEVMVKAEFRQRCNLLYTDCFHLVLSKYH
jgi:hypothetical protein